MAEFNGCSYCLSAHTYLALNVARLPADEIDAARDFRSTDARAGAALRFARHVAELQGRVADVDLEALNNAGFDVAETIEIVATVALNVLTNHVNNVARTDIDFPAVSARTAA